MGSIFSRSGTEKSGDKRPAQDESESEPSTATAESLLIAALRQDSGDHVFKYLAPRGLARLEQCLTSKLVFVPAGEGDALLRMVAGRRHVEVSTKKGATLVVLGEGMRICEQNCVPKLAELGIMLQRR